MAEARREVPKGLRIYLAVIYALATALMLLVFGEGLAHQQWGPTAVGVLGAVFLGRRTVTSVRAVRHPPALTTDPDLVQARNHRWFWVVVGSAGLVLAGALIGGLPLWMTVGLPAYMLALALFGRWSIGRAASRLREQARAESE